MRVRSASERRRAPVEGPYQALLRESEVAYAARLGDGSLYVWLALEGERAIGTATLMLLPTLPRLGALATWDGRIRNVYVEPAYRRRGIATLLVRAAMSRAEALGVDRLTLGTSPEGRSVYERLGFRQKEDELMFSERAHANS